MNHKKLLLPVGVLVTLGCAIAANDGDNAIKALQSVSQSAPAAGLEADITPVEKTAATSDSPVLRQTIAQIISPATALPGVAK